jgi:hypothetical protein
MPRIDGVLFTWLWLCRSPVWLNGQRGLPRTV